MSARRRLDQLEANLPPRTAVLHWLGEVHAQGSLDAYVAELLDQPAAAVPLVAVTDRARAAARKAHSGEPRASIREAERRAKMDTLFLIELVLEIERVTSETIRIGSLRLDALRWELRARTAEGVSGRRGWTAWRSGVLDVATDIARTEASRLMLEQRYLDRKEILSPGRLTAWHELQEGVSTLVSTMPSLPGGRRRRRPDREVAAGAERTAPDEAARIVEHARTRTLDVLGEHTTAKAIVERALREET